LLVGRDLQAIDEYALNQVAGHALSLLFCWPPGGPALRSVE
jgi:hypothetical protein